MSPRSLLRHLRACFRDRRGATAIEYGLICAILVLGLLVAMRGLATATVGQLNRVDTEVHTATR